MQKNHFLLLKIFKNTEMPSSAGKEKKNGTKNLRKEGHCI